MVSVHEELAGNLILRHPLSYLKIPNNNGYLEEGEIERITATQNPISRSYNYNNRCICEAVALPLKVEFILETGCGSGGGAQLIGLSSSLMQEVSTFRMDIGGETTATLSQFKGETFFHDFVRFKGHIFALHPQGSIYVLDHESLLLIQTNGGIPKPSLNWRYIRFVVSNDQLYVVVLYYQEEDQECLTYLIYRIYVDSMCELTCEQVEDLGDEVFFIGIADCFSVSARDLPPPWKPNCVVFSGIPHSVCGCPLSASDPFYNDPEVFFLEPGGLQHSATVSSLPPAYSHFFYPPAK